MIYNSYSPAFQMDVVSSRWRKAQSDSRAFRHPGGPELRLVFTPGPLSSRCAEQSPPPTARRLDLPQDGVEIMHEHEHRTNRVVPSILEQPLPFDRKIVQYLHSPG